MEVKKNNRLRLLQILSLFFILVMGLALTGCGKKKKKEASNVETVTVITTEATNAGTTEVTTAETTETKTTGTTEADTEKLTDEVTSADSTEEKTTEKTTETTTISEAVKPTEDTTEATTEAQEQLDRDGSYTSKEDVALFLHLYGELPQNFITKKEAQNLGWSGGSLEKYAPGKCIGGDKFGNYEGLLPAGKYHECDIDTLGKKNRGAKRLIYSDDGRIYYTEDHYETFTLLYGEE